MTRKHTILPLLALLLAHPALAEDQADDDDGKKAMPVVTVEATRTEQSIDESMRSISVVDSDDLDRIQPQSVPQAVSYLPNVQLAGGPRSSSQTVNIRGLSGTQVLQTIDGVQQRFESGHRPTYLLDPDLIERIEVVKGPTSSLWGSGAIGGVVAQDTLQADDLIDGNANSGGLIKATYNGNDHQGAGVVALAGREQSFDWVVAGYYEDSDDIELGNDTALLGSASRGGSVLAKTRISVADGQTFGISYLQSDVKGQVPTNGTAEIDPTSNFLINRDSRSSNAVIDYALETVSPLVDANFQVYWNGTSIDESRVSDGRADNTELDVYGINFNNVSEFGTSNLLYGIDAYREDFSAVRGGMDRPVPPDARTRVWAAYAQFTTPLSDRVETQLGARYDHFETEASNLSASRDDSAVSPSAAISWQATDWMRTTLRYDEAFGAPGSEELYSTGTHFCLFPGFCNEFMPNPDLNPEEARNIEWLATMRFGDLAGGDELTINASVFQNNVDNFIEQIVTDPTFFPVMDPGFTTWVNVDAAKLVGFEVEAQYAIASFNFGLSYGQTQGENKNTGQYLFGIPANKWVGQAAYTFLGDAVTAGLRVTHADAQDKLPSELMESYGSYTVTDIYATWQPGTGFARHMQFDLTVNNLADKYYRVAFDQLYQPGREVILSARYIL